MNKFVALLCVISWSGFWAFGYLALTADIQNQGQIVVAIVLAALGFLTGTFAYLRLSRGQPMDYTRVDHG